jgi:mannose-6-phosphate isomerase
VFERIDLPPSTSWCLEAERETWLLVLSGSAIAGAFDVATGDAIFAQSDRVDISAGNIGLVCLAAYTGASPVPNLLQRLRQPDSMAARRAGATLPPLGQRQPRQANVWK